MVWFSDVCFASQASPAAGEAYRKAPALKVLITC
jgi:hypothetical protein